MIKLVEVKGEPKDNRGKAFVLIKEFVESDMSQARLDTSGDQRPISTIYGGIYGYLRIHPEFKVKVQMIDNEIYLSKFVNPK